MTRTECFSPVFVDRFPAPLEPGIFYISIRFKTTAHLCASGCGNRVILPLSPGDWAVTYNGKDVSIAPSIGNWEYPCRAHYWIRRGRVEWATSFNDAEVEAARRNHDRRLEAATAHGDQEAQSRRLTSSRSVLRKLFHRR